VKIEKGGIWNALCTHNVSVYEGEVKTLCGTYTKPNTGSYVNEIVQCRGKRGDSVMLEQSGCTTYLSIYEIKVYEAELVCKAGSYKNDTECPPCPIGTWSSETDASSCTDCTDDRSSPPGSKKEMDCFGKNLLHIRCIV